MGIYSSGFENYGSSSYLTDTLESIMEDSSINVDDGDTDILSEGYMAIAVMNENYTKIMEGIGRQELLLVEETGSDVYTENVFTSIYNTLKSFVLKIWERIKALFKRFMMIIDGYTKTDKEFVNKYRKDIFAVKDLSDFTFKGYKSWTLGACNGIFAKLEGESQKAFKDRDAGTLADDTDPENNDYKKKIENFEDDYEKKRAEYLTKPGSYTAEEFRKEIREMLRGGDSEKEELSGNTDIDVHQMTTELLGSKDAKKGASDAYKNSKKVLDTDLKNLERIQKEHIREQPKNVKPEDDEIETKVGKKMDKASKDEIDTATSELTKEKKTANERKTQRLGFFIKTTHATKADLIILNSEILNGYKERSRQYKACLTKIVAYRPKKESFTESYDGSYGGENFLANIQLK